MGNIKSLAFTNRYLNYATLKAVPIKSSSLPLYCVYVHFATLLDLYIYSLHCVIIFHYILSAISALRWTYAHNPIQNTALHYYMRSLKQKGVNIPLSSVNFAITYILHPRNKILIIVYRRIRYNLIRSQKYQIIRYKLYVLEPSRNVAWRVPKNSHDGNFR